MPKGREGDKYGMQDMADDVIELIKVRCSWGRWGREGS